MRKNTIILFVLLSLSICYSRQIQIPIPYENSPTTIELYNIKGQKVLTKEFVKYDAAPISLSNNLANQIYIMRIKNGNKVFTRKFMPDAKIQFVGNFANTGKISTNEKAFFPETNYQNLLRSDSLGDSVTNIIYINGMWTPNMDAESDLSYIKEYYENVLKAKEYPGDYIFTLGYNKKHGNAHDLAELLYQWKTEFNKPLNALEWLAPIIGEEYYEEAMGIPADAKKNSNTNYKKSFLHRLASGILIFKSRSVIEPHSENTNELRKIMNESFEKKTAGNNYFVFAGEFIRQRIN